MKVLVYGAGAVGCYLTHVLCAAGNEVTLAARGAWKEELERNGVRIHHRFRRKETVDRPKVVDGLSAVVHYDAVFTAMPYQQMGQVLDDLARADTPLVVLVGNNMAVREMERYILEHTPIPKTVLFGFQSAGGQRDNGRVLCNRWGRGSMSVGGAHSEPDREVRTALAALFKGTGYRLNWVDDMDGWCKSRLAWMMPIGYLAYGLNCDLTKASFRQLSRTMEAVREGYGLLFDLSYSIRPANSREKLVGVRGAFSFGLLWVTARTALSRPAVSAYFRCMAEEMEGLDLAWETLRAHRMDFPMPNWNALRSSMPEWAQLRELYGRRYAIQEGR